jgi:hypothetical protein
MCDHPRDDELCTLCYRKLLEDIAKVSPIMEIKLREVVQAKVLPHSAMYWTWTRYLKEVFGELDTGKSNSLESCRTERY